MTRYDVLVIGGGAAGLMCALAAGRRGRSVLVLERSNKIGKKILMSGGGRCNFTNLYIEPDCFLSANPHFCKSALKRYTQWDFIAMVDKHGIAWHERKHGQLFCDDSSRDILDMLVAECEQAGVQFRTRCEITAIEAVEAKDEDAARFRLETERDTLLARSLVVATGGLSIPSLGSSGYGHEIARQFGMQVLPLRAGLVPFMFSDGIKKICERLSGVSFEATLSVGKHSFTEDLLFTHRGLSGPAVLQLSNYWKPGDTITIDLLPGTGLQPWLKSRKQDQPKKRLRNLLPQLLPKSLVQELEPLFWSPWADKPIAEIPDPALAQIADQLHGWKLKPSATEGYRTAEVTLGGVDTEELSSRTMESKTHPGLYFIGEVVDVTGHLGGFNFQWAWSSGHAAGQFV